MIFFFFFFFFFFFSQAAKKRKGAGAGGQQSCKKGAAGVSGFEEEPKDGSLFDIVRYGRVSLQVSSDSYYIISGHSKINICI